ncbi:uncharacterized protein LOC128396410 [Panonychus citri]|uniref:uncharacterized protein LOC128396410 n=1 Tax=Panonychus citri TaxID=50023 RepID=UPI0023075853|nr:uncharacterized protein LOC128396410 [Panonychus citri]
MSDNPGNTTELRRLKDLRLSSKSKFKILMNYFEERNNKNLVIDNILTELTAFPIIKYFQLMMKDELWLKNFPTETINELAKFFERLMLIHNQGNQEEQNTEGQIEIQSFTNNQIKNLLSIQVERRPEMPKTWYNVSHLKILHTIIVRIPGVKNELNKKIGQITAEAVEKLLEETTEDSGSAEEVTSGFDSAKIKCTNTSDRIKIFNFIKRNKPQWEVSIPPIQDPQVKLIGVKFDPDQINLWMDRLYVKNRWKKCWKMCVKHFYKTANNYDVIVEVDPALREWMEQNSGCIAAGYKRVTVVDHFDIKQCRNCMRYGHLANKCTQMSLCPYCGGTNHFHESCPVKEIPHKWKCPNCHRLGENALETKCLIFMDRLQHEMEKKNYQYKYIMA